MRNELTNLNISQIVSSQFLVDWLYILDKKSNGQFYDALFFLCVFPELPWQEFSNLIWNEMISKWEWWGLYRTVT